MRVFKMNADNATLCYSLNNSSHNDALNKELHKINTLITCINLSLNIDNTNLMILYTKQRSIIYPDL